MVRPRRPVSVLVAVAVLVAAELAARVLAPELPAPDRWGDAARRVKAAQVAALDETSGCVDVVVAGDSMARDGIVPAVATAADPEGRTVYNAALDAATPELAGEWLGDVVLPALQPGTVVLAVSSLDLHRTGPAQSAAMASYRTAPATRQDFVGRMDRWVGERSALVAERAALRDPTAWGAVLTGDAPPRELATDDEGRPVLPGVLGPDGEGLSRRELVYAGPGPAGEFTRTQLLAGYDPGPDPAGRLAAVVDDLGADGAQVALLVLPVHDDFAALHPGGEADLARARAVVAEAAETTGAPLVDLGEERWPEDHFADTHHLNGVGADELSRRLPALLRGAGVSLAPCSPGGDRPPGGRGGR